MVDPDQCQKILSDLETVLRKNALLESFDIISNQSERANRSPVCVLDNNLGLESWCVVPVYVYATDEIADTEAEAEKLIQLTNFLLLVNPELEMAWNHRRRLYLQRRCHIDNELQLSHLALCRKPKTAEAYNHRKWVLDQEMKNYPLERRQAVLHSELLLCELMASKYFSNYHAWDYRRHLLKEFVEGAPLIIESELQRTKDFVQSHVSDHSGMSYRQYILLRVNSRPLFETELTFTGDLIRSFPGHEALWMHRRFCVLANLGLLRAVDKRRKMVLKDTRDPAKVNKVTRIEESFVHEVMSTAECWQRTLCERHIRWMKNSIQLNIECNITNGSPGVDE